MEGWREVTKEEFFTAINGQDVSPYPTGKWPYLSLFKTRSGHVWGKIEGYLPEGSALEASRYWLPKTEGE